MVHVPPSSWENVKCMCVVFIYPLPLFFHRDYVAILFAVTVEGSSMAEYGLGETSAVTLHIIGRYVCVSSDSSTIQCPP